MPEFSDVSEVMRVRMCVFENAKEEMRENVGYRNAREGIIPG